MPTFRYIDGGLEMMLRGNRKEYFQSVPGTVKSRPKAVHRDHQIAFAAERGRMSVLWLTETAAAVALELLVCQHPGTT
jgi:hypothetical protein